MAKDKRITEKSETGTAGGPHNADPRFGQATSFSGTPHSEDLLNKETPVNTPKVLRKPVN